MDRKKREKQLVEEGFSCLKKENYARAKDCFTLALKLNPDASSAYWGLGKVAFEFYYYPEAIFYFRKAIEKKEGDPYILHDLGKAYFWNFAFEKAKESLWGAYQLSRKIESLEGQTLFYASYLSVDNVCSSAKECERLGISLENSDWKKNLETFRNVIKGNIEVYAYAMSSFALAALRRNQNTKAVQYLELSLSLAELQENLNNKGLFLFYEGHLQEAEKSLRKALTIDEGKSGQEFLQANLAHCLLRQGKLKDGWRHYESRFGRTKHQNFPSKMKGLDHIPFWKGKADAKGHLFVNLEQGFGDIIQFMRFLPLAKKRFQGEVTFLLPDNLYHFLRSSKFPVNLLQAPKNRSGIPEFLDKWGFKQNITEQISLASIPHALGIEKKDIPYSEGYLKPDPKRVRNFSSLIKDSGKLKVGFVWGTSSCVPWSTKVRSIPLEDFLPILNIEGIDFYSLQYGRDERPLVPIKKSFPSVKSLGIYIRDFADTAAIVENLDLVICPDTSIIHIVGAIGKETWGLIPYYQDWRWFNGERQSSWYQSVKLIYQKEAGNWEHPIEEVCKRLKERSACFS